MNDDLNGRQSRDWDEVKNENLSFFARSNENKELKERAMPRRATTIFSEVRRRGEKAKFSPQRLYFRKLEGAEKRRNSLAFSEAAPRPSPVSPYSAPAGKFLP